MVAVARRDVAVGLDRAAERQVQQAAKVVGQMADADEPVYGVNTGFGDLATVRIPHDELRVLQRNLLRSHAVGVGLPLPEDVVRAILLLRANTLAAGRSGVRAEVIDLLCDMLNRRVHPVIPKHGSVGASGDLAPLAHAALVLIGEGETLERASGAAALKAAGLKPIELAPKEGVSLINGTQVMTAIGCLALHDAEVLATTADVIGAMSAEALRATDRAWDPDLHATRPHPGQQAVAANLRSLMAGSPNVASHRVGDPRVQDPYSVRCMPQVHGAARDALAYTRRVLEIEINAVTDNPIVFAEDHRRARRHQRGPDRPHDERTHERVAPVPDDRGRHELGIHGHPVHGRCARHGEPHAVVPRRGGVAADLGRDGGPCQHGRPRRPQARSGREEHA